MRWQECPLQPVAHDNGSSYLVITMRSALPLDESKPWMRYAGMVASGDPDSSRKIDNVIYGQVE